MRNEHCTSICRYILCTCLLRVDWFLSRSYNEAFRVSCLAKLFMLSSDFGCAWHALMFAMATRDLRSEICWHAVFMTRAHNFRGQRNFAPTRGIWVFQRNFLPRDLS